MYFQDRRDAGKQLAKALRAYGGRNAVLVLALPRGGVVVAAEVARALKAPLDIVVPRKIGAPGNPEFAIGAITETGERILDNDAIAFWNIPQEYIEEEATKERKEARRRLALYRGNRPLFDCRDKTTLLIDDGIATGLTMQAAIASVQKRGAEKIIIAVPVTAPDTIARLRPLVHDFVFLYAPEGFTAVGTFYTQFDQTTDEEVRMLLEQVQ